MSSDIYVLCSSNNLLKLAQMGENIVIIIMCLFRLMLTKYFVVTVKKIAVYTKESGQGTLNKPKNF